MTVHDDTTYLINLRNPEQNYLFELETNSRPLLWTPDESVLILFEQTHGERRNVLWNPENNTLIDTSMLYDYWSRFTLDGAYLVTNGIDEKTGEYVVNLLAPPP